MKRRSVIGGPIAFAAKLTEVAAGQQHAAHALARQAAQKLIIAAGEHNVRLYARFGQHTIRNLPDALSG